MLSLGAESILIGDVVDGVPNISDRVDIGKATVDGEALILLTGIHQLGGFVMDLAVGKLITELISINANVVRWSFLHDYCLIVRRSRNGDGYEGAENDDLIKEKKNILILLIVN